MQSGFKFALISRTVLDDTFGSSDLYWGKTHCITIAWSVPSRFGVTEFGVVHIIGLKKP